MPSIKIDSHQTFKSLQEQFNQIFPYLRIEFFTEPHPAGQLSDRNKMIQATHKKVSAENFAEPVFSVQENATVSSFEKELGDRYGLYVQVFRKSGNIWLETSATEHWTLGQQNEEGKMLQEHFRN